MKEIYELEKMFNGDGDSIYYNIKEDALKELETEFEIYVKEFKNKTRERYEYSLHFKHYQIKTDNLQEAIKLSNLDEEDVCYDLGLDLEELDREISFREMEYILKNIDYDDIEKVFETVNEELPFYIGEDGKKINTNYVYNLFKEEIKSKLDYEYGGKEVFYDAFENSRDSLDFAERAFLEIRVLDDIYAKNLGLSWEDFSLEMLEFYKKAKVESRKENIMDDREFYVVRYYKEYHQQIENIIVDTKEEAEEILEGIYSTYDLEDYSYNKSDDLLTIEKYTIKDDNIKDFETLEKIFYEQHTNILDYYSENKEDNKFFLLKEVDNYIYQGMEIDGIKDKLDEIRKSEKKYNDNYLQDKVDKLCSNFQEAISKCIPSRDPIGFGNYTTLDGKMHSCKDRFCENLEENGFGDLIENENFWKYCFNKDIEMIDLIPDKFKTEEMCKQAVKYWGCFIRAVPDEILEKNKELLYDSVKERAIAVMQIPKKYLTKEFYEKAIDIDLEVIEYAPKEILEEYEKERKKISETIKEYINLDDKEIKGFIKSLDKDTINKFKEIDEKMDEYHLKYALIKILEKSKEIVNEKFVEDTINDINKTEKSLLELEEKYISGNEKYREIAKQIIESIKKIKNVLLELIRDFQIESQILKEKFINKNNEEQVIDNEKDTKSEIKLNLTENDKIKMANIKELPESILVELSKEDNIRVLRKLAINENLPKEAFLNLAKNSDLKLKELLLENKNISSEKLNELYNKNIKNDEIIGYIAKNQNAPRELLEKISNNLKTTNENRKLAFQNKNHPINNKFIKPEISKEKSNELYQKLVFQSDIRKNNLLDMFKNEEMYADEKGNAIFPIKDNNNEVVGAYKIDFSKNERPVLLENGNIKEEYLKSANNLSNKIFESLQQEEVVEQVEEIEIE